MFHKSVFGGLGNNLTCDVNGFVPEMGDGPWQFVLDHGSEITHSDNGNLTEYGKWWEEEGFFEWRDEAIEETEKVEKALEAFRSGKSCW